MSRFDPNTCPDRFAFEAYARRIRAAEAGRIFGAATAWLRGRVHDVANGAAGFAAAHSHHQSAR